MYTPLYCNPLLITKIITQYPKRGLGGSRAGLRLIPPIPLNWAPRPKAAVPNRSIAIDWSIARPRPVDREMFGSPPILPPLPRSPTTDLQRSGDFPGVGGSPACSFAPLPGIRKCAGCSSPPQLCGVSGTWQGVLAPEKERGAGGFHAAP